MCKLEDIFVIDDDNKLCDEMRNLTSAEHQKIASNITQIQRTGRRVKVCCMYDNQLDNEAFIKSNGYCTPVYELYEMLIQEHNEKYPNNILWRWPRPDEDE